MVRIYALLLSLVFLYACSGKDETEHSKARANNIQTEKAIEPLPTAVNNRISIKRQFVPDKEPEQFVLDYSGESFDESYLSFVILNKDKDTLFARKNVPGKDLLGDADENVNSEDERIKHIYHKMSTFFSLKNFSCPPYTINDPNSDDFAGNIAVWNEVENDSTATCFEFSLLPDGGSEVLIYSRLMDSIVVYDRTH